MQKDNPKKLGEDTDFFSPEAYTSPSVPGELMTYTASLSVSVGILCSKRHRVIKKADNPKCIQGVVVSDDKAPNRL